MIHDDVREVFVDEKEIQQICKRLGEEISRDYEGKEILALVILKGSMVFAADLIRYISVPLRLDFMQASSYGDGTKSTGIIKIKKDMDNSAEGKHIIIIEDIIDSGNTLFNIHKLLEDRGAASVNICTFLSKPSRREIDVDVKYIGKEVPDEFLVGYGLDFAENYRSLPYVGVLKPQVYAKI
ncbi:MAG: hypoxanthine phosphoribosyltransferase [Clostridia bacterium]|nr:hypoxanthine phosphoribosyltransferase [Clostridia bacterium]